MHRCGLHGEKNMVQISNVYAYQCDDLTTAVEGVIWVFMTDGLFPSPRVNLAALLPRDERYSRTPLKLLP